MAQPTQLEGTSSAYLLETPEQPTTTAVLFLPGISGGAFTERFQPVADACVAAGMAVARVSAWENAADVEKKTLSEIYKDMDAVVAALHVHGYTTLYGIGKSFGGAVMLTFPSSAISKKVLWAPAIGVTEEGATVDTYLTEPLGTLEQLTDMKVDREYLEGREAETLILHGTADDIIPYKNSEAITSMLPNVALVPVAGADHSFKDKEHEATIIKATVNFLVSE